MRKQVVGVLLGITVAILFSSCNSGVGQGGGSGGGNRDSFRSCEVIGFTSQNVADIYNSALVDRDNGNSYYEERQIAANACASSCSYEAVCANGCTSCAYDIIDVAYSKLQEQSTKSSTGEDSTIGVIIKDLL